MSHFPKVRTGGSRYIFTTLMHIGHFNTMGILANPGNWLTLGICRSLLGRCWKMMLVSCKTTSEPLQMHHLRSQAALGGLGRVGGGERHRGSGAPVQEEALKPKPTQEVRGSPYQLAGESISGALPNQTGPQETWDPNTDAKQKRAGPDTDMQSSGLREWTLRKPGRLQAPPGRLARRGHLGV